MTLFQVPTQKKTTLSVLLLIGMFFAVFHFGQRGIDFGYHWDERLHIKLVKKFATTGEFLPHWYQYPSVLYDILVVRLLTDLPQDQNQTNSGKTFPNPHLSADRAFWKSYWLKSRSVFLFLTLLASVWLYVLILIWRKDPFEALLGSLMLLCSWEINYHARWIAPDGLVMSFGTLSLLFMYAGIASSGRKRLFLRMAAVVGGIACGAKYPAGILLLPLICASFLITGKKAPKYAVILEPVLLVAIFSLSFVITTPGALIEPSKLISDVMGQARVYSRPHGGYTVDSGLLHGRLILEYFALAAFSKYRIIALAFFGFSGIGLYHLVRHEPKIALWFLCVPVCYVPYFSSQHIMVVRNLLIVFPFVAVLAARGVFVTVGHLRARPPKMVAGFAIVAALAFNLAWLHSAAESIHGRKAIDHSKDMVAYLVNHPEDSFYLTPGAKQVLKQAAVPSDDKLKEKIDDARMVLFMSYEVEERSDWITNRPGVYDVVSGPYEVNWDYYSSWKGDSRVLAVSRANALRLKLDEL